MEINIKCNPKEIADLVTQLQSRQSVNPLKEMKDAFKEALSQATYDTDEE